MYAGRGNFQGLQCREAEEFQRRKLRALASLGENSYLISGFLTRAIYRELEPTPSFSQSLRAWKIGPEGLPESSSGRQPGVPRQAATPRQGQQRMYRGKSLQPLRGAVVGQFSGGWRPRLSRRPSGPNFPAAVFLRNRIP